MWLGGWIQQLLRSRPICPRTGPGPSAAQGQRRLLARLEEKRSVRKYSTTCDLSKYTEDSFWMILAYLLCLET